MTTVTIIILSTTIIMTSITTTSIIAIITIITIFIIITTSINNFNSRGCQGLLKGAGLPRGEALTTVIPRSHANTL